MYTGAQHCVSQVNPSKQVIFGTLLTHVVLAASAFTCTYRHLYMHIACVAYVHPCLSYAYVNMYTATSMRTYVKVDGIQPLRVPAA